LQRPGISGPFAFRLPVLALANRPSVPIVAAGRLTDGGDVTAGSDIRAIWIASVPRTGSMWTFNVVRELMRSTGISPKPELVPQDDAEMEAIGRAGIAADDGVYVLKVHTHIATDLPHSFYVVTHRDIRDSVVSFMRFTHSDFEAGLRFAAGAIRSEQHFSTFPTDRALHLDYAEIIGEPEAAITRLGWHLGIPTPDALIAGIVGRYSKARVRERLVAQEQVLREKIAARQPVDRRDFVAHQDRSLRAFDTATGFQSGHVSDYREGDWRKILTAPQQAELAALIAEGEAWRAKEGRGGGA